MQQNRTLIEVQSRLLTLYREVRMRGAASDPNQIIAQLSAVKGLVRAGGANGLLDTYQRFFDLIAIRVPAISQTDSLRLKKTDLRSPDHEQQSCAISQGAVKPVTGTTERLGPIAEIGIPGISLVTCCMNRNDNLLKALPSWMQHSEVKEIVIVDWSSTKPVTEELARHAIRDSRIRVVRVDGEPRWILSYAFNVGFRVAKYDQILKVDADIVLTKDFFVRNPLHPGHFIAGNWRKAAANQVYVNGFFFAPRAALRAVGGFNEFITTYGWDDDDIYHRMTLAGFHRSDVIGDCILHLDHSDAERMGSAANPASCESAAEAIMAETGYKIRRNRYIANVMPCWDDKSSPVGFGMTLSEGGELRMVRDDLAPSVVPSHVDRQADFIALWEIASWRLGSRIRVLEEPALRQLLRKPLDQITTLDIELASLVPDRAFELDGPYCVLRITDLVPTIKEAAATQRLQRALLASASQLKKIGLQLVVQAPIATWPEAFTEEVRQFSLLPMWKKIGELQKETLDNLLNGQTSPVVSILVETTHSQICTQVLPAVAAVLVSRGKFYIDAQHGLGNRLRAIGSAAAIAEATDRELVIVWQPDDHCECRFSDLFAYDGAVIDQSFIQDARTCDIHNYMTIEGGEKGAVICSEGAGDIYARSAFVLNSPHSHWRRENRFIQSLRPIEAIQALVNSVRNPNDVSVHVRMEGGRKDEHLPYESTSNWTEEDHDLIDHWRAKSHFSHFMKRIDRLIEDGVAERIFIAADKPATYEEFRRAYGSRLAWLQRSFYDRSAEQLQYALADAILLSRASLLLGSTWSSFSELAQRLSPSAMTVEMSGKDF